MSYRCSIEGRISAVSSSLHLVRLQVSANHHLLQLEVSVVRAERCIIHEYNNKSPDSV